MYGFKAYVSLALREIFFIYFIFCLTTWREHAKITIGARDGFFIITHKARASRAKEGLYTISCSSLCALAFLPLDVRWRNGEG
jgi:hypothetical protein